MEYPHKPLIGQASQQSFFKSIFSIISFIALYYFLIDDDFLHACVIVFVIFIHELGHYIAMKKFHYEDVSMLFVPLAGAFVSGQKEKISERQKSIIILAGPVPGIILGLIFIYLGKNTLIPEFIFIAKTFLLLNAFNLLPISPLDGGKLIETIFFSSKAILQTIFSILSIVALALLSYFLEFWILMLVALFLILQVRHTFIISKIRRKLKSSNINYHKSYEELDNSEYWEMRKILVENVPQLKREDFHDLQISAGENTIIEWIKSVLNIPPIKDNPLLLKIIFILTWLTCLIIIPTLSYLYLYDYI